MISYHQAKTFLDDVLELPAGWEGTQQNDPLEFLRLFLEHHARHIPFQNVTMAAVKKEKRAAPTEEDIITQGLSGIGGCCINLNFFTKILFKALGLDSHAIKGTHNFAPVEGTHCMVVVKLGDGNVYMVEAGGAFPILDPVPMQNLPFRILSAGGFPYEFRQISDDLVARFHIGGGLLGGQYVDDKTEMKRTSWDMISREFSEFDHPMFETFTNPVNSALLRGPMMCRYFFPEEVDKMLQEELAPKNGTTATHDFPALTTKSDVFVFAFKRRLIIGDALARRLVKEYENYKEMAPDLIKYFPMLDPAEVDKACEAWSEFEVVPTPYDNIL